MCMRACVHVCVHVCVRACMRASQHASARFGAFYDSTSVRNTTLHISPPSSLKPQGRSLEGLLLLAIHHPRRSRSHRVTADYKEISRSRPRFTLSPHQLSVSANKQSWALSGNYAECRLTGFDEKRKEKKTQSVAIDPSVFFLRLG